MRSLIVAVSLFLFAGQATARPLLKPRRIDQLASKLGLAAEQVQVIKDLALKAEQQAIAVRAQLQSTRLDLRRMMKEGTASQDEILAQVEVMGKLRTEMHKSRVLMMYQIRQMLTPEQFQQLQQLMSERRRGRGKQGLRGRGFRHRRGLGPEAPADPPAYEESL